MLLPLLGVACLRSCRSNNCSCGGSASACLEGRVVMGEVGSEITVGLSESLRVLEEGEEDVVVGRGGGGGGGDEW